MSKEYLSKQILESLTKKTKNQEDIASIRGFIQLAGHWSVPPEKGLNQALEDVKMYIMKGYELPTVIKLTSQFAPLAIRRSEKLAKRLGEENSGYSLRKLLETHGRVITKRTNGGLARQALNNRLSQNRQHPLVRGIVPQRLAALP